MTPDPTPRREPTQPRTPLAGLASGVVGGVTVVAVVVVAVIAAVVSYSHMQQLAAGVGEAWRSWLIPLSIDGLVVAASMVLVTRRRRGVGGGGLAWCALGGGVGASLAANMADARPDPTAVLVAGWPAVAFAVALELLLQQRRAEDHEQRLPAGSPGPARAGQASQAGGWSPAPVAERPVPAVAGTGGLLGSATAAAAVGSSTALPPFAAATPAAPIPGPVGARSGVGQAAAASDAELVGRVRELLAGAQVGGRRLGRRAVASALGVTEHRARVVMDLAATDRTRPARHPRAGEAMATFPQLIDIRRRAE